LLGKKLKSHKARTELSVGRMTTLRLDNKGRVTLPKEIRESLNIGEKILVINAGDHLKMIPLPRDPIRILHGALNIRKSFKDLRRQAELAAEAEAKIERG